MYLMPMIPTPRKRIALSGLSCNCRGGHYMSGFGDDGAIDTSDPSIATDLVDPGSYYGGQAFLLPATSSDVFETSLPVVQTSLTPPPAAPTLTNAAPGIVNSIASGISSISKLIGGGSSSGPAAGAAGAKPGAASPVSKYLLYGGLGLVAVLALGKR